MKISGTQLFVCALAASPAFAQSMNVDVGPVSNQPSASYAATGLAGYWNSIPVMHNTTTNNLRNLAGFVTPVNVWQYGGTELRSANDPATSGDDEKLMDDCQITYTQSLETCLFFRALQPGDYEVSIYAWMPNRPDVVSYTSSDEEFGYPHYTIGGAWPGHHQLGVTYSRHICTVTSQSGGLLRTHSGIVPGELPADGAAFNGIQLRLLPARTTGDMNCDGRVNGKDIPLYLNALLNREAYYAAQPTCRIDNADMNLDHQITTADTAAFVFKLLNS